MATIRKRKLKSGRLVYDIQVRIKDKGSGEEIVETSSWRADENMSEKKADNEAVIVADKFEKEVIASISGCSARSDPLTITFRDFANNWLEQTKRKWTLSYYVISQRALDFACSRIGGYKIKELTPAIIQNFFNEIDNRTQTVIIITPKPDFREILKSHGLTYKNLWQNYHIQHATLAHALRGMPVSREWANSLTEATKISFNKLFNQTVKQEPYAYETNDQIKRVVRAVLSLAKKNRLVEDNFAKAEYINFPKRPDTQINCMDDEAATKFYQTLENYPNIRLKTAMLITLFTGFRRGEVCGLEWSDINFQKRTIEVQRSLVVIKGYGTVEKSPKTKASQRRVAIPLILLDTLVEYRKYWTDLREACGDYMEPSDKLFTSEKGGPIYPGMLNSWLNKVLKDAELNHFTVHSLRHTNITLQLAAGVPIVTVCGRAGHSDPTVTGNIYAHWIESSDRAAADTIDHIFGRQEKNLDEKENVNYVYPQIKKDF